MHAAPARSPSTDWEPLPALSRLSPEAQLVLASAGTRTDATIADLVRRPLDWNKVLWLAQQERATVALWERVNAIDRGMIPAEVAEQFRRLAMVSDFRMLQLRQRLAESVHALAAAGIEVMLLKGAAVAKLAYDSITERPMHDIDLLVAPGRAWEARELLLGAAWRGEVNDRLATMYEKHHHLPPLSDAQGTEIKLELHTSLFLEGHPFVLTAERVWAERQPATIRGVTVYLPHAHHLLLHACLHFAWSNQLRSGAWRTIRDVERIAQRAQMDWDGFRALVQESKAESLCYWTFRLASGLVGAPIPEQVLAALHPGQSDRVMRRLERHFVHHILATEWICPSVAVGWWMWELGMRPERSGFGAARPWRNEDRIRPPWLEELRGTEKVTSHLRRLSQWGNYLRALMQPA